MRIQNLEDRTGLERPTIRFYEREGLLQPKRLQNGYREYSEDDAEQLLKIKLLRQLGMSIDRIKALQQGSANFLEEMEAQIRILAEEIDRNTRAREVCRTMYTDGISYNSMDAEHYLKLLQGPLANQPKRQTKFREELPEEIHPWRRFFARSIDYSLFSAIIQFLIFVILRIRIAPNEFLQAVIAVSTTVVYIPFEALMLHFFGTTPGKLAMGIRVEWIHGGNLPMWVALARSAEVCIRGDGLRIPVINIACNHVCYCRLTGRAATRFARHNEIDPPSDMPWDEESELIYSKWEGKRGIVLACIMLFLAVFGVVTVQDMAKPKYRGEITVQEFSENYNYYYALYDQDTVTRSEKLQPDGEWYPESDQYVTIYIDGQPGIPEQTFFYETENGYLRGIHYENSWRDIFVLNPVPNRCIVAAIAVVMSQEGNGIKEQQEFGEQLEAADFTQDGELKFNGVELRWCIDAMNCTVVEADGKRLIREDENLESSVSMTFDITIVQ